MDLTGIEKDIIGPFGGLILAVIVLYFLYRLHVRVLETNERAWEHVGTMAEALKENNALTREALSLHERRG